MQAKIRHVAISPSLGVLTCQIIHYDGTNVPKNNALQSKNKLIIRYLVSDPASADDVCIHGISRHYRV